MENIKALSDYVLIKEVENEDKTASGILIADEKQAPIRANVVAVGPNVQTVQGGHLIMFNRGLTTATVIDGEDYLLLKEADIFLILNYEKP